MKAFYRTGSIFIVGFTFLIPLLKAQYLENQSYQETTELIEPRDSQLKLRYDEVFLQQIGQHNQATIAQYSRINSGNTAYIIQNGQVENVLLNQYGINNSARFYQDGYKNSIDISERGSSISSEVFQSGSNNEVKQKLSGDRIHYAVFQNGYNHKVIDLGSGSDKTGYTVKQTGLIGMTVTITHY